MRLWKFALAACLLFPASAFAQTTLVTGTVNDLTGVPWAGASLTAQLVVTATGVNPGSPTVQITSQAQCTAAGAGTAPCQIPINGTVQTTLDPTGSIPGGGVNFYDNTKISPAGTSWYFTVSISPGVLPPFGTGPQRFNATITITGASQNIGTTLSLLAPALTIGGVGAPGLNVVNVAISCGTIPGCFNIKDDAKYDVGGSYSLGSNQITTSALAPAFVSSIDNGKQIFAAGNCQSLSEASCKYDCPQGLLTVVSAHVDNTGGGNCTENSSATANSNNVIWCTDDGPQLVAAFQSMFPGGANSTQPQDLELPGGSACTGSMPFITPNFGVTPQLWPVAIHGHNTQIVLLPKMPCNPGVGHACALDGIFSQDQLGNLGMADDYEDISFFGGGTDVPDASATYQNPAYCIQASELAHLRNVWCWGWDWNRPSANVTYGIFCDGAHLDNSGSFAGGNFGILAKDVNGIPCVIDGGNQGGSQWNSIVITGFVSTHGIYTNQPRCSAFANKLCYGVYINTSTAQWSDFGSDVTLWSDSGSSYLFGSDINNFSSIFGINLAGGSVFLSGNKWTGANGCNMTGGNLYDLGGNGPPFCGSGGLATTGGNLWSSASITGTACATGNWALTSGWGTSTIASVTAGGDSHRCQVVITGAAGAAGPVLTWTFPTAYASAPGSCQISSNGTLTGEATGAPTKTAVTFTFTGTPSAQTYRLDASCGP